MESVKMINASPIHVTQPSLVILVLVEFVNAAVVMLVLEVPQLAMKKHVFQLEML